MLHGLIMFIHVLACIILVVVVLLQSSKGSGLSGTFGGSGMTGGVFGGRGVAPLLIKITTVVAVIFMVTSLSLSFVSPRVKTTSLILEKNAKGAVPVQSAPAVTDKMPVKAQTPGTAGQTPANK